jgi:synaptobrevin family protein YKT6
MKLLAVALYHHKGPEVDPACLGLAAELSSFGYFQRASVKEMLSFLSKTIVQRTAAGQRQTVKQEDYFCHVHVKDGGIAGVAVTDRDYPTIAAFSVVGKAIEEYLQTGDESWRTQTEDGTQALAVVEAAVTKYQVCVRVCAGVQQQRHAQLVDSRSCKHWRSV